MNKRKKLFGILISIAMVISIIVLPTKASESSLSGTGSESDPYIIASLDDLKAFRDSVNQGNSYENEVVKLTSNIEMDMNENWEPIGNGVRSSNTYTGNSFKGIFDGNGMTISHLSITESENKDAAKGLFGVVDGGVVKNLTLNEVNIQISTNECAGSTIGLMVNESFVDNVKVSGNITAGRGNGGLVGRMIASGTISNCVNDATVVGLASGGNTGGIVGAAYYTSLDHVMKIQNCINNGEIDGMTAVGGIAGLSCAIVEDCMNHANITGNGTSVGGIVGEQRNYGNVTSCVNKGNIKNLSNHYGTGGIVGWLRYTDIGSNYPLYDIISVVNNINYGNITGGNDAGGIVGTLYNSGVVKDNENGASSLQGVGFAAGIVGNIQATEKPGGTIPLEDYKVYNNVSKTSMDNISANCKGQYVYNNPDSDNSENRIYDNTEMWAADVDGVRFTLFEQALKSVKEGSILTLYSLSTEVNVIDGVKVVNKTGHDVVVNGNILQDGNEIYVHTHELIKTEAVEATCTKDGNIEYWTCDLCEKYFKDEQGKIEISIEDTLIAKKEHHFKDGLCTECGANDPNYVPVEPEKPVLPEVVLPSIDANQPVDQVEVGMPNIEETESILKDSLEKVEDKELYEAVKEAMDNGKEVVITPTINKIVVENATEEVKKDIVKIQDAAKEEKMMVTDYLDLNINVIAGDDLLGNLTETTKELTFQLAIPKELIQENRIFYVIRIHNGKTTILNVEEKDGIYTFKSDQFSTYALAYKDVENVPEVNDKEEDKTESPETSDNYLIINYILMMIISGLILVILRKKSLIK